ncbi:hypothetical protein [Falsiroseomonas sp.]|uniref:hypothetical protein n=1 Tax=Falsiroseomonas sp. TaxID=2870721 RepID=UPI002720454A|nr:hypothetical protein [Falsiroseomonas sp.]MDO9499017.1 hypothetical protein [Falsiroseomonas sp.]
MVAYSFQKRFVDFVQAGLEPGPWCPGMKRHTLRAPRMGRAGHARPEQPVQLYTAMRTKQCRLIGRGVARVQIPVTLIHIDEERPLVLKRCKGPAPRSHVVELAPVVRHILDMPIGAFIVGEQMEEFARTDGFRDLTEMAAFFKAPQDRPARMDLVLIGWAPGEPG